MGRGHAEVEKHARERIGTKVKQIYGGVAECVRYVSAHDYVVRWEDGKEQHFDRWEKFIRGELKEGSRKKRAAKTFIGMRVKQTCGEMAEIVAYRNKNDCDVRYDDGTFISGARTDSFKKGQVPKISRQEKESFLKESRTGAKAVMHDGHEIECIRYGGVKDCDFCSDTGMILEHRNWANFEKRTISSKTYIPKNKRVGTSVKQISGHTATCIKYIDSASRDNEFRLDDGTITKGSWGNFMSGHVGGKSTILLNKERARTAVGTTVMQRCGLRARCTRYSNAKDFSLEFEDGRDAEKAPGMTWTVFLAGRIRYPMPDRNPQGLISGDFYGYVLKGGIVTDTGTLYECTNKATGEKSLMMPQDILKIKNIELSF